MKSSTLHLLIGIGTVLTAVATGITTKIASDKVNEERQVRQQQDPSFTDLTKWEKFKIYARWETIPLTMAIGTGAGIYQSYKESQEAIKTVSNVASGASTFINGYRELTKEALGAKKEDAIYTKAVQENVMPKTVPANLILGENDCLCMVISPGLDEVGSGLPFVSNATKIKEATLSANDMFVKRASKSMLNDASFSIVEWFDYLGVKIDNRILDHLGWTYQHDGVIEISFRAGLTNDNKPILGIEFTVDPHYIE